MARSVHIRPRLVDLGMNRESSRIDGFVADHDLAIFVDENEVADADLREVSREWV